MEVSAGQGYIVLTSTNNSTKSQVEITPKIHQVISAWGPSTRISPIWGVKSFDSHLTYTEKFSGSHHLIFIGPTHPEKLAQHLQAMGLSDANCSLWVTLGAYNTVVCVDDAKVASKLVSWARKSHFCNESWKITDGRVDSVKYYSPELSKHAWQTDLVSLAKMRITNELYASLEEFCALMASTLSRSLAVAPQLSDSLSATTATTRAIVSDLPSGDSLSEHEELKVYTAQGLLTYLNAALSRFSSQAYSGVSPIKETECHFWTHSLLGIGTANLALSNFVDFIWKNLGPIRIPQRIETLKNRTSSIPALREITGADDFLFEDHLNGMQVEPEELEDPLVPFVTYFSGRDGFRSYLHTLSAPLSLITHCNSKRWTLLTLSHEISHVIIRGVLGELYPTPTTERERDRLLELYEDEKNVTNWLEAIQHYILHALDSMDCVDNHGTKDVNKRHTGSSLTKLLDKWHHEVEELMVHVFDFLYFYRENVPKYIESIWLSWSVIPNIGNRIPEYVIRSLCAVMVKHIRRTASCESVTLKEVRNALMELDSSGDKCPYVPQALEFLENNWENLLLPSLVARAPIIRIVRAFLYSDKLAGDLWKETHISGSTSRHKGYGNKVGILGGDKIDNPLRWIDSYTNAIQPKSSSSLWMLQQLAFNVEDG